MAWKSSSAANAFLDAVDDRELGGALLGFLEQPLRLVEQARVLERDAHRLPSVVSRLTSESANACSRCLPTQIIPLAASPCRMGT